MKEYPVGTTFKVCGHDELIKKGWRHDHLSDKYTHKDFPNCSINVKMLEDHEGDILTIKNKSHRPHWYYVEEEEYFIWPVFTFLSDDYDDGIIFSCKDGCVEGMTEIFGWIICKTCGKDLRQIR